MDKQAPEAIGIGPTCLDNISFEPDLHELRMKLRIKDSGSRAAAVDHLAHESVAIARPRALYRIAYVEARDDSSVMISGVRFDSRVLAVNLENVHRVFAYLATCGIELHEWAVGKGDMLDRYYADAIAEMALRQAMNALKDHLVEQYSLGRTSTMSPGSLPDWPIQAQRPLFALLGDIEGTGGVRLTDSLLMIPTKSVSGIRFPTEQTFASCQLCDRPACPGRQAPYEPELYQEKFHGVRRSALSQQRPGGE